MHLAALRAPSLGIPAPSGSGVTAGSLVGPAILGYERVKVPGYLNQDEVNELTPLARVIANATVLPGDGPVCTVGVHVAHELVIIQRDAVRAVVV